MIEVEWCQECKEDSFFESECDNLPWKQHAVPNCASRTQAPSKFTFEGKILPLLGNPYFFSIMAKSNVKVPYQLVNDLLKEFSPVNVHFLDSHLFSLIFFVFGFNLNQLGNPN